MKKSRVIKIALFSLSVFISFFSQKIQAQIPVPESGVWGGTVIIKRVLTSLNHTKTATLSVVGGFGHSSSVDPRYFTGIVTNLDSRENAKSITDQMIWFPIQGLTEGSAFEVSFGNAGGEENGTISTKSLRYTTNKTTQKIRSISLKAVKADGFFTGADGTVEISVSLTWKKPLPTN